MAFTLVQPPRRFAQLNLAELDELDAAQRQFVTSRAPWTTAVGGPGTGKSAAVAAKALHEVQAGRRAIMVCRDRIAAETMHAALSSYLLDQTPVRTAHTVSSLAYALLSQGAQQGLSGQVSPPPRLVTGADADAALAETITLISQLPATDDRAQRINGALAAAGLPREVLGLDQFRQELRDAIARAQEYDCGPDQLDALATDHDIPQWALVAAFYREYEALQSLASATGDQGARLDVSALVVTAAGEIRQWENPQAHLPEVVVIDDAQEVNHAGYRLFEALADAGVQIAVAGNPDQAVESFRGARAALLQREASRIALVTSHQHSPAHGEIFQRVANVIPTNQMLEQRQYTCVGEDRGAITAHVLRTPAAEEHHVVNLVRSWNLLGRLEGEDQDAPRRRYRLREIAVITRNSRDAARFASALAHADIAVRRSETAIALTQEPAVLPLLSIAELALNTQQLLDEVVQPALRGSEADRMRVNTDETRHAVAELYDQVRQLYLSPYIAASALQVEQLYRHCAVTAREHHYRPLPRIITAQLLFIELVLQPEDHLGLETELQAVVAPLVKMMSAARNALRADAAAEGVLWAIWQAANVAETWKQTALGGGDAGAQADHNLDAIMALFESAKTHAERNFGASAAVYFEQLRSQRVATGSLAAHGSVADAVSVLTVAQAAGSSWPAVIIAGVSEGVWPDMRLRDTTMKWQQLAEVLSGVDTQGARATDTVARREVFADEARMFLAALACGTGPVVVLSPDDGETLPSRFLEMIDQHPPVINAHRQLTLRGIVGQLRHVAESQAGSPQATRAELLLAELAARDVPGADPQLWPALWEVTSTAPLYGSDEPVAASPSQVESMLNCPLKQFLERAGAVTGERSAMDLGTIVHQLAEEFVDSGADDDLVTNMLQRLETLLVEMPDLPPRGWGREAVLANARQMVLNLAHYLQVHATTEATAEQKFDFTSNQVHLRGKIDRIEKTDEQVAIIDFKTGKTAVSKTAAAENPQLGIYQFAVRNDPHLAELVGDHSDEITARLVYPRLTDAKGALQCRERPALEEDAASVMAMLTKIREIGQSSQREAIRGDVCRFCALKHCCPAQVEGDRCV
ncbi:MAG: PD-(D/E)XK nuclease family protein [Bowdeniella nasicola]|nr:PD-(D/E)XK nuclease family protein [Bowdeniella nasicola]